MMSHNDLEKTMIEKRINLKKYRSIPIPFKVYVFVEKGTFDKLEHEFARLSYKFETYIEKQVITWVSVSDVAREHGLTPDNIRKKLDNGNFEEGKDFKKVGGRIQVHQGAIGRLQRQRRSNNG